MQYLAVLLLLSNSAAELSADGRSVRVFHRSGSELDVLAAGLDALERAGEIRLLEDAERLALAERLMDVPSHGHNPVSFDRDALASRARALLEAKDALNRLRVVVADSNREQSRLLIQSLKRMGLERVRRGPKRRGDLVLSLDSKRDLADHRIFEYASGFAEITVYGTLHTGESLVSVARSNRKALGAMRAVKLAERDAAQVALHALLFDVGEKRASPSLASN